MLVPAISRKEELEKLFAKEIYTEDYFLYYGYRYGYSLPEIKAEENRVQYAIVDNGESYFDGTEIVIVDEPKVIGYLAYSIQPSEDTVCNFGLYSFGRGNPIIGKDVFEEMERLVKSHRRIEWRMVGGNPVQRHYDKFCEKFGGNKVVLHEVCSDPNGNYRDEYIYEIVR